jgi:hypothetical protein
MIQFREKARMAYESFQPNDQEKIRRTLQFIIKGDLVAAHAHSIKFANESAYVARVDSKIRLIFKKNSNDLLVIDIVLKNDSVRS